MTIPKNVVLIYDSIFCGCDELEIELETGKDVLVVMRTLRSANVNVPSRAGYSR